jgi:methionyl-tRNA synthetase
VVDHFGSDAFRYYFLRAIQFGSDGSFSWEDMSARYTSELANGLGNLASRVTAMVELYFDGRLPAAGVADVAEGAVSATAARAAGIADERMRALDFSGGLAAIWELVVAVNGYLTDRAPWKLAKDESARTELATVLVTAAEGLRALAVLLNPVMPRTCAAIWTALGAEVLGPLAEQRIQSAGRWDQLPEGSVVTKTAPLFPRLED